jgi:hypothetical protein
VTPALNILASRKAGLIKWVSVGISSWPQLLVFKLLNWQRRLKKGCIDVITHRAHRETELSVLGNELVVAT